MILGATLELKGTFSEYSAKPEAFEIFVLGDSFEIVCLKQIIASNSGTNQKLKNTYVHQNRSEI